MNPGLDWQDLCREPLIIATYKKTKKQKKKKKNKNKKKKNNNNKKNKTKKKKKKKKKKTTKNINCGHHGLREEDFFSCFFFHYKSMRAYGLRGVANLDPSGLIGRIYVGGH